MEKRSSKGFTLIEILVVVLIVGILSTAALVSYSRAMRSSRDKQRKIHLENIALALELYHDKHGTYRVKESGYYDCGQGWVTLGNYLPMYPKAVTRTLFEEGFLNDTSIKDPKQGDTGYMIYLCDGAHTYSLSATLEDPTQADIDFIQTVCNGVGSNGTYTRYHKNYAIAGSQN